MSYQSKFTIHHLTETETGHLLHHNNVFSFDDRYIVFDERNDETKIGETAGIGVIDLESLEEKTIYITKGQTLYGPGVGAASFGPVDHTVIFIHGLFQANAQQPYAMTRRFGYAVSVDQPYLGVHMDARDTLAPFTAGSLRGGTHSHTWSGDGRLISFTYNDELSHPDLRVVGVMIPVKKPVEVPAAPGNNSGQMYSSIVTQVVEEPIWGSDEISKAFDECWIGRQGYYSAQGVNIPYAIAFQGNTRNSKGEIITEIYVVDIDPNLVYADQEAVGTAETGPTVPRGIKQRRLSVSERGLSDLRHWLRSSADGRYIYGLTKDEMGRNQLLQCRLLDGRCQQISDFEFSVASPINISYKGDKLTFYADNNVFIYTIETGELQQITDFTVGDEELIGAPVFSRSDDKLVFNQMETRDGRSFVQIKLVVLSVCFRKTY